MVVVMKDHRFPELGTEELLCLLLWLNRAELTLRFPHWTATQPAECLNPSSRARVPTPSGAARR
jgi:hypothetical protein